MNARQTLYQLRHILSQIKNNLYKDYLINFIKAKQSTLRFVLLLVKRVYVFVWLCAHGWRCFQRPELLDSPGTEVRGTCKPPDKSAGNQTCVL